MGLILVTELECGSLLHLSSNYGRREVPAVLECGKFPSFKQFLCEELSTVPGFVTARSSSC